MILKSITITNIRNIEQSTINLGDRFNIFFGKNGAGKSSVLEAIYLLSSGKSFRTHQIKKVISHIHSDLFIFAKKMEADNKLITLGLRKSSENYEIKINGEKVKSISELAIRLPVLVVTQDSHRLIDSGPTWRRQFLDWGLFHVKHDFFEIWKNYSQLVKQRNSALANNSSVMELESWSNQLAKTGNTYNSYRVSLLDEIKPYFIEFSRYLLGENEYNIEYLKGWPTQFSLNESLLNYLDKEYRFKYTMFGPHRADFRIEINNLNAKDVASRGQQKLFVLALNMAMLAYLEKTKAIKSLVLLDDLGSELDIGHVKKLLDLLARHFSQVCITTANIETLPLNEFKNIKLFHVEHGEITEVTN